MRQLLFTFALSVTLLLVSCQETTVTREQVLIALDSLEHKLEWLEYKTSQEKWELNTTGISDSLNYYRGLYEYVVTDPDLLRVLEQGRRLLHDDEALWRCELMHSSVVLQQVEFSPSVASLRDSLLQLGLNLHPQTPYDVNKLCCIEHDPDRREQTYRTQNAMGEEFAKGIGQLFRLRNQATRRLGYNNCLALSLAQQGLMAQEYLKLLDRLDSLTAAAYGEIIQKMQSQLGSNPIEIWDMAFAYRDVNQRVDRYLPIDSQLPLIERSLEKIGFDLDKLPIYLSIEQSNVRGGIVEYLPIKPPYDVRLTTNLSGGLHNTRVLLYNIGLALHQTHIFQEQALYINALPIVWAEGMAQTIAALCNDEEWLTGYAGLPQSLVESYNVAHNEQNIIRLRMTLVDLMFEYEAYTNPNRDLNKLYWDLFERYMMLPRHDDIKPWATVTKYVMQPASMPNHLIGEMISAQIVYEIKQQYTSLSDNTAIGSYLNQNFFRFGIRYNWRDLLERGTGEKLNPEYLVRGLGI